ncbi:MAG: hypothetical protein ACREJ9_13570 [Candidatus Rokuibacteriota bacterium]
MTNAEYEQLVALLQGQFTQVEQRLDRIDQRFAQVDQRFDQIDERFVQVDQRFTQIDQRFDTLQRHVDDRFREVFGHFDELYHRLDRREQEYIAILQALRRVEGLLADERGRREIVERNVADLKRQVSLLQARIEALEGRLRQ